MKYLINEELKAVLDIADSYGHNPKLYKALISVMVDYGLRVGEAVNLKVDDFLSNDTVRIHRQKSKITHCLPIRKRTREALLEYSATTSPSEYLFSPRDGEKYCKSALQKVYKRIATLASEKLGKDIPTNIHSLRHTCGVELANSGASVLQIQSWLGHKHVTSTNVYISMNLGNLRGLINSIDLLEHNN